MLNICQESSLLKLGRRGRCGVHTSPFSDKHAGGSGLARVPDAAFLSPTAYQPCRTEDIWHARTIGVRDNLVAPMSTPPVSSACTRGGCIASISSSRGQGSSDLLQRPPQNGRLRRPRGVVLVRTRTVIAVATLSCPKSRSDMCQWNINHNFDTTVAPIR